MFCPKCGASNVDGAKFCASCGVPLRKIEQQPQAATPELVPQPAQTPQPKTGGRSKALIAAVAAVAAIAVIALVVFLLTPKNVYSFGSTEAVSVGSGTSIVPSAAKDSPLTHYYVRVREAATPEGSAIDVLDWPRLEVNGADGFCLADFVDEDAVFAGTYQAVVTSDDGAEQALPPLEVADTASASEEADAQSVVVVPAEDGQASEAAQKKGRYAAFLAKLNELRSAYGDGQAPYNKGKLYHVWAQGLCFARLVDFGDGLERMVVAYNPYQSPTSKEFSANSLDVTSEARLEVFEYDEETDSAVDVTPWDMNQPGGGLDLLSGHNLEVRIETDAEGKRYIHEIEYGESNNSHIDRFYGIDESGALGLVATLKETDYSINGVAGTQEDYEAAKAAYSQAGAERYALSTGYSPVGLTNAEEYLTGEDDVNNDSGNYTHAPAIAVKCAKELAEKLTWVATNPDDAPTKTVGGASVAETETSDADVEASETDSDDGTQSNEVLQLFSGTFAYTNATGETQLSLTFAVDGVTAVFGGTTYHGRIDTIDMRDSSTFAVKLKDVTSDTSVYENHSDAMLYVLVPVDASPQSPYGKWGAVIRGDATGDGYFPAGTNELISACVEITESDQIASYAYMYLGAHEQTFDGTSTGSEYMLDASSIDFGDPMCDAYDPFGSIAQSVYETRIGPKAVIFSGALSKTADGCYDCVNLSSGETQARLEIDV